MFIEPTKVVRRSITISFECERPMELCSAAAISELLLELARIGFVQLGAQLQHGHAVTPVGRAGKGLVVGGQRVGHDLDARGAGRPCRAGPE
jgi:hypothetical protein